ncbi:hypothetical protein A3Q56_00601 [Intoshia linei]|uniref:Thyroglobulin type-1 domain-containing protein n=1 Tax=Intoshia linei TaxID=1819745 RepID=A0A177BBC6_9BILA|nr:hypothetical protein A3Q56_00601 [Intoshia linei]
MSKILSEKDKIRLQKLPQCNIYCSSRLPFDPTCASNNVIYPNTCLIRKLIFCYNVKINITNYSSCTNTNNFNCFLNQFDAQRLNSSYIPTCSTHEFFYPLQCQNNVCWCSNNFGSRVGGVFFKKKNSIRKCLEMSADSYYDSCSHALGVIFINRFKYFLNNYKDNVKTFKLVDSNFDNGWSFDEFKSFIQSSFHIKNVTIIDSFNCIDSIFKVLDIDQSMNISFEEFSIFITKSDSKLILLNSHFKSKYQSMDQKSQINKLPQLFNYSDKIRRNFKSLDCFEKKKFILKYQNIQNNFTFTSNIECHSDGTYISKQCLQNKKYCWCVDTISGSMIQKTITSNHQNLICFNELSSAQYIDKLKEQRSKLCNSHKTKNKILEIFVKEFKRNYKRKKISIGEIINWRFSIADANFNFILDDDETAILFNKLSLHSMDVECIKLLFNASLLKDPADDFSFAFINGQNIYPIEKLKKLFIN